MSSLPRLNPASVSLADAARLLSAAAGRRIEPQQIQADIDAGLPTNPDGTIHLVRYAAWLVQEISSGGH